MTTNTQRHNGAFTAFLPETLRRTRSITARQKDVLGCIICYCTSDTYNDAGCMAISYDQIMEECHIVNRRDVTFDLRLLVTKGYITYAKGKGKGQANRYTLTPKLRELMGLDVATDNSSDIRIKQLEEEVKELKRQLADTNKEVDVLKTRLSNANQWFRDWGGRVYIEQQLKGITAEEPIVQYTNLN